MRKFAFLLVLLLASSGVALACGKCSGRCGGKCVPKPELAYAYQDPHYIPDCAPASLRCFHDVMVPMMEARGSHESSYIRQNAEKLYRCACEVKKARACCEAMDKKPFKRAAKDLTKSCDRLRDLCFGGSDGAVYEQMKLVEEEYVRLANLCN